VIVVRPKPLAALLDAVGDCRAVLVAGCRGCAAVCGAGGEKEVGILAVLLRLAAKRRGLVRTAFRVTVHRQCDPGFLAPLDAFMELAEICLSLGCGVGVQYIADRYPAKPVIPAVDTVFAGGSPQAGLWEERCRMCGDCVLGQTGGICPVTRCAKSLLNGPCGGATDGRCEVDPKTSCAWHLIYERLRDQNRLEDLAAIRPPKDWSSAGAGVRSVMREDLMP